MGWLHQTNPGLVLSGGGARGLAHIGVIRVLEKNGIRIAGVSGSSMGALIGGIYAQNPDAERLYSKVVAYIKGPNFRRLSVKNLRDRGKSEKHDKISRFSEEIKRRLIINLAASRLALMRAERLRVAVNELLEPSDIQDCKIPFVCVATDLLSGKEVIFTEGKIRTAVEGSSAIPGFLPPLPFHDYLLIDGSVINNFPGGILRKMGIKRMIAVDVSLNFDDKPKIDNVIDLVLRSSQITARRLGDELKMDADVIIRPQVGSIHWSEFNRIDEIIKAGEEAAASMVPRIRQMLSPVGSIFVNLFRKN